MPTLCSVGYMHRLISPSQLFEEGTIIIPMSQRGKWRLREMNSLAQGYTGGGWQSGLLVGSEARSLAPALVSQLILTPSWAGPALLAAWSPVKLARTAQDSASPDPDVKGSCRQPGT